MKSKPNLFVFLLCLFLSANFNYSTWAQTYSDSQIKAAYLMQFAMNIQWPNELEIDSFRIGVYGASKQIVNEIREVSVDKTMKGKPISVKHFTNLNEISRPFPNILYLEKENNHEHEQVFKILKNSNTLLITDESKLQRIVMINFKLEDSKKRKISFEINSVLIEKQQGLTILPRLLLLGGSVLDITELFQRKEEELLDERARIGEIQKELQQKQELIQIQNQELEKQQLSIDKQRELIEIQQNDINTQRENLENLLKEISIQQHILRDKTKQFQAQEERIADQQRIIAEQTRLMQRRNAILDKQSRDVDDFQKRIDSQKEILTQQAKQIQTQKGLLYIFLTTIVFAFGMFFFIYKSFQNKKRANLILEETNRAIENKNKEIEQQKEELKAQAELLSETNKELEKLSIVASETDNSIVIMDSKGIIEWVNPAFTRITGYSLDELYALKGRSLFEISENPVVEENYLQCIRNKQSVSWEVAFQQKSNETIWLQTTLTPILNPENQIVKLVAIDSDISEIKKAHEETISMFDEIIAQAEIIQKQNDEILSQRSDLEKTQKQLFQTEKMASIGVLTAGIAHEINNPINFVYAGVNSIMRDFSDLDQVLKEIKALKTSNQAPEEIVARIKEKIEEYDFEDAHQAVLQTLNDIRIGAERTAEIVEGLRNFSRTESEVWGEVNIHRVFDGVLVLLKNTYKNRIEIVKNYDESLESIECKPGKINQVLMNILSNAVDAIEGEGTISISTFKEGEKIVVSVKDTGTGMSDEVKAKIFDPFFTTKEVGKGVGLGLAITYAIIEEHEGEIVINSEEGKGTDFIIKLPVKRRGKYEE